MVVTPVATRRNDESDCQQRQQCDSFHSASFL